MSVCVSVCVCVSMQTMIGIFAHVCCLQMSHGNDLGHVYIYHLGVYFEIVLVRSEERRVGKECRSR